VPLSSRRLYQFYIRIAQQKSREVQFVVLKTLFSFEALGSDFQRRNGINNHVYSGLKFICTLKKLCHF